MEYGFILKRKDELDNPVLFFIYYIDEFKIVLIPSDEPTQPLEKPRADESKYIVVYQPRARGVCGVKRLNLNQMVRITYSDRVREGKIIKKKDDTLHVRFTTEPNSPTEVFEFNYRGLPENILQLEGGEAPKEYVMNDTEKIVVEKDVQNVETNSAPETYYYSMEQQVQELLEELTRQVDIKEYKTLQEINTMIARYIEIHQKYYNYDNNYTYKAMPANPVLEKIRSGTSMFPYVSENLSVRQFMDYEMTPRGIDLIRMKDATDLSFPPRFETTLMVDTNNDPHKSYASVLQIADSYLETLHIDYAPDQTLYYGSTPVNVILNAIDVNEEMKRSLYHREIYTITTVDEIPLDGIVVPSIDALNQEFRSAKMSTLLNQTIQKNYLNDHYVIGSKPLTMSSNMQFLYKDKPFYAFLNEVVPNVKSMLPYVSSKLYNVYDYIRQWSLFDMYELNATQNKLIYSLVKTNMDWFKTFKPPVLRKSPVYTTDHAFAKSIAKSYLKENYYTSSELFQMSLIENHFMTFYDLYTRLNQPVVKELMGRLNTTDTLSTMTYDKIYETTAQLKADTYPQFRDVGPILDPNAPFKRSIQILWETLDTSGYKNMNAFETSIKKYVLLTDKTTDPLYAFQSEIQEWYNTNVIVNGMIGYVQETQQSYVLQNNQWEPYVESTLSSQPELNQSLHQQIRDLTRPPPPRPPRDQVMRRIQFIHISNMAFFKKYNDAKKIFSNNYIATGAIVSPHQEVLDMIVVMDPLEERLKLIRHFCELYTIEGPDPNWLYCIDSGSKLLPLFLKKLAYVNHEDYYSMIDQICFDQGEQQDEFWVDKYSGYTIKKINFNEEEGFTSDGFKLKTREVIQDQPLVALSEVDKDILTILNALGISYEPLSHISDEFNHIKKKFKKYDVIILYAVLFIFIQGNIDTRKVKASFYSCKTSFAGFPAVNDETATSGIEYMLCVHKTLTNSKKLYKKDGFIALIRVCLDHSPTLKLKLSTPLFVSSVPPVVKSWELFLPRLNTITSKKLRTRYYKLFEFQKLIHEYVSTHEPNVKWANGAYKPINHYAGIHKGIYVLPESVLSIVVAPFYRPLPTYLQHYNAVTKNDDKYKLPRLIYSPEKIRRILKKDYDAEPETDKLIRNALHRKKIWKEPKRVVEKPATPTLSDDTIKRYKRSIDDFVIQISKSIMYKFLDKFKSKGERDVYVNTIFKNLWNDLIVVSYMKNKSTYSNPSLRKKLNDLNPKHYNKLVHIIENTYVDLFIPSDLYSLVPDDIEGYRIPQQTILYKFALCEAYKTADKINRHKIDKYIKQILTHLNINIKKIETNNEKERRKEKKDITDGFKSLNDNERKAEYLMKTLKLGKWNVGSEIFRYKADAYDKIETKDPDAEPLDNIEEETEFEEYNIGENAD